MAHEPHLDHPGEVTWWVGHGPAPVLGDCPHTACQHRDTATVAWGPDYAHYELVVCLETGEDRCGGACRGWHAYYPAGSIAEGMPVHSWHGFRQFDATGEHCTTREEARQVEARIARDRAAQRASERTHG